MRVKYLLKSALKNLRTNRSRSVLTMLGIFIGVMSIMIIMTVGNAAEVVIKNEITALGADIIWIEPGREPKGPTDFTSAILSNTLKSRDIDALNNKGNAPHIKKIVPAVSVPGSMSYRGETYRPFITGWSAEFMGEVFGIYPEEGVYFDDFAIRNKEKVAVIGGRVKDELFGESDAVGKIVKIGDKKFKVVGVLPDKGQVFFLDIGKIVVIPYSTARVYMLGIDHYNEVWVRVDSVEAIPATVLDIKRTLRDMHGITNPEKDDFYILTQDNLLDQIGSILGIFTAALASIVAIALVVGGIGVMNIMFVSVTERTKEIGLRKALGARDRDILRQFLIEAIILTALGGIIGIIVGFLFSLGISFGISQYLGIKWEFIFPLKAAILGIGVSGIVGIVFGLYPAMQAARKSPIEALRYE